MSLDLPKIPIPIGLEFTPDKVPYLLLALSEKPSVSQACEKVGIHVMALEIARLEDPKLDEQIEWAMGVGFNTVEASIIDRAIGVKTPRVGKDGKIVHMINPITGQSEIVYDTNQSDKMTEAFAKRIKPKLYGNKIDHNVSVKTVTYMPQDQLQDEFQAMLDAQAEETKKVIDTDFHLVDDDDVEEEEHIDDMDDLI